MENWLLANLPTDIQHEITQYLYAGQKIQAIKVYRQATLSDLLTAKLAIEEIEKNLVAKNPYAFTNKTTAQGSGLKVVVLIMLTGLLLAGLAVFIASSLENAPTLSTNRLNKFLKEIITTIDPATPEPESSEPPHPTATIAQQETQKPVYQAVKEPIRIKHKPEVTLDTSPYQPLTEVINSSLDRLYQEKLANPAYQIWKNKPDLPRGYQDYLEEHRIKAKRAALAKKLIAPAQQFVFTIPLRTNSVIHIDGLINKDEWRDALLLPLTPEETESFLYLQRDADWLYLAADVPKDITAAGFDQFRFYIHADIDPAIRNERIHVNHETEQVLGGIRETTVKWQGAINENDNERWKKFPISDWQIYRLARGAAGLNPHRQYEAKLYLKEIGLSQTAPFPVFVEVETDPVYENGQFKKRQYLGGLGSQEHPVWFKMQ